MVFLSEVLDKQDEAPDGGVKDLSIGKNGMCLVIGVKADYPDVEFTQMIFWQYSKLQNGSGMLYGNGRNGEAPKQGENRFLVGDKGVKYDDIDGVCDDNCGGDIHAGYKFWITYDWDNDADFY